MITTIYLNDREQILKVSLTYMENIVNIPATVLGREDGSVALSFILAARTRAVFSLAAGAQRQGTHGGRPRMPLGSILESISAPIFLIFSIIFVKAENHEIDDHYKD